MNWDQRRGETDKEWVARGGCKVQNSDLRVFSEAWEKATVDPTLRNRHLSPEQQVWKEFFVLTVKDALGMTPDSKKICVRCHIDAGCGCYKAFTVAGDDYIRRQRTGKRPCRAGLSKKHTIRDCARMYINSEMCEEDCEALGISVTYLRQYITKGVFSGKDFDTAKALHLTGRTGKIRSAD